MGGSGKVHLVSRLMPELDGVWQKKCAADRRLDVEGKGIERTGLPSQSPEPVSAPDADRVTSSDAWQSKNDLHLPMIDEGRTIFTTGPRVPYPTVWSPGMLEWRNSLGSSNREE